MKTKREVLETFEEDGACIGIHCKECPFYQGIHEGCDIHDELVKLGAKIILENGNVVF